jgi:hypothetical protein
MTGVKCVRARVSLLLQEIEPALLFATNEYTSLFPVGLEIQMFEFFYWSFVGKIRSAFGFGFFQLLNVFCSNFLAFLKMLHSQNCLFQHENLVIGFSQWFLTKNHHFKT